MLQALCGTPPRNLLRSPEDYGATGFAGESMQIRTNFHSLYVHRLNVTSESLIGTGR